MKFETGKIGQPLPAEINNQSTDTKSFLCNNKNIGGNFIIVAWIFEILAFFLGLSIAFSLVNKTGNGIEGSQNYWNSIVIGSGLVMVALAELAKVPFSIAVYRIKSWLGKGLCVIALTVAVTATFLNVYRALDQFYADREYPIQTTKDSIHRNEDKLELKEGQINFNTNEKIRLVASIQQITNYYKQQESLIENNYLQGIEQVDKKYKTQLLSIQNQISNLQGELVVNSKNEIEALKSAKRKSQQDTIRKQYAKERTSLRTLLKQQIGLETELIKKINGEKATLQQQKRDVLTNLSTEYKDQQKSLAETNNKIDGLTTNNQTIVSEMDALKNEQIDLTSSLAALVFDLETYRFAGKYFNRKPIDITPEEIGLITTSLCVAFALIPSLTGVFLALFGVTLQEQRPLEISRNRRYLFRVYSQWLSNRKENRPNKKRKISYRLNALMIALRKKVLKQNVKEKIIFKDKIVEVPTKEFVEVEKIVEVKTEVPRIIEKEIIVEVPKVETIEKYIGIPVPKDHDYFLNNNKKSSGKSKQNRTQEIEIINGNNGEILNEQYS